jgi:hypothetical protein
LALRVVSVDSIAVTLVFRAQIDRINADITSLRVMSPDTGRNPLTNEQRSAGLITGIIPLPVDKSIMNVEICNSTWASVSPLEIPRAGILNPVYLTH